MPPGSDDKKSKRNVTVQSKAQANLYKSKVSFAGEDSPRQADFSPDRKKIKRPDIANKKAQLPISLAEKQNYFK